MHAKTKFPIKPKTNTKVRSQKCCWKWSLPHSTGTHEEESGYRWSWCQRPGLHQELSGGGAGAHLLWEERWRWRPVEILSECGLCATSREVEEEEAPGLHRWQLWFLAGLDPTKHKIGSRSEITSLQFSRKPVALESSFIYRICLW